MEGGEVTVARLAHALRRFWALGVAVVLGGARARRIGGCERLRRASPTWWRCCRRTPGHIAPIYVDTYTGPGKVLYRFSAVLKNLGGAMDLYMDPRLRRRDAGDLAERQPDVMPDPNMVPTRRRS